MSTKVHALAQAGYGAGTNELYDRVRPSYKPSAIAHIRKAVEASGPLNIVELGAGTGIFTRALLVHPDWTHAVNELRAVEPSAGMREQFTKTVTDPRVSIREGTFDETGVEDGWADLIVIAQAYHWCPDYGKAAIEFARVLKQGGVVALIWNLEDRDRSAWVSQLPDRLISYITGPGTPQPHLGLWRATFSTPGYQENFEPPEEEEFEYVLEATRDIVVNRMCSKSYIAILPPEEKQKVIEDIDSVLKQKDILKWIDKDKGIFEYPYTTTVVLWRKK